MRLSEKEVKRIVPLLREWEARCRDIPAIDYADKVLLSGTLRETIHLLERIHGLMRIEIYYPEATSTEYLSYNK